MESSLDVIVAILAVLLVIFTIIYNVKKLKNGSCSCGSCKGACCHCKDENEAKEEKSYCCKSKSE